MSRGFKSEYLSNASLPLNGYASSLPIPNGISYLNIYLTNVTQPGRYGAVAVVEDAETAFNLAVDVSVDGRSARYFVVQIAALNSYYSHPLSDGGAIAAVL